MKKTNLAKFSDLLFWARANGYGWNQAHEFLVDDGVPPMYEARSTDYHIDELECWGWSDDSIKVVKGFMLSKKIKEMTLI